MGGVLFRTFMFCAFFAATGCTESSPKLDPLETPAEKAKQIVPVSKESFKPQLDILFVIDDSGSMGVHQKNLAENADLFADAIIKTKYLDYHIGVITSSVESSQKCCGQLVGIPNFVERSTPDGIKILAKNMIVGTGGHWTEKFFDPVVLALTPPNLHFFNKDFYRQSANLAIIFITDTEDQSDLYDYKSFYDFLEKLKGSFDKIYIAAAHIPDRQFPPCGGEISEINNIDQLTDFFNLTQANAFSLCDKNFGQKLAEIGAKIASQSQTMYLKQMPKKGTIQVSLGGVLMPEDKKRGWSYNPEKVAIEFGNEIEWDLYPDGFYPEVDFEILEPLKKK